MWTELASLAEAPEGLAPADTRLAELSEYIWLIQADSGRLVAVAGLYFPTAVLRSAVLWLLPYPSLRPRDAIGLRKLTQVVLARTPDTALLIARDAERNARFAEWLGFMQIAGNEEHWVYKWPH